MAEQSRHFAQPPPAVFTLLGVCGTEKDLPLIEDILNSKDRKLKAGLDAMIGSYLAIKGPSGLHLVEDCISKTRPPEFTDNLRGDSGHPASRRKNRHRE